MSVIVALNVAFERGGR